jgi:lipoprotein NlpD
MRAATTKLSGSAQLHYNGAPGRLVLVAVLASAVLAGCASRTSQAPVADMSENTVQRSTSGTYVVRPGDTLYKIAQANGVSVADLSRLNNITDPSQLRVGQVLRLNGNTAASTDTPSAGSSAPVTTAPVKPAQTPEPTSVARASDASLISWSWPAKGKVLQGFNSNTKGIDIAGKEGDPVYAAADGKVMYAGNGVRGLGNLILLGHSNGFITAYAHNQSLLVKTGQQVKKGDKIAAVGQTDTTSPRLHFEIRRRGTPVNPVAYLPEQ